MQTLESQLYDMNKSGWLTQQQEMMIPTKDSSRVPAEKDQSLNMTYSMEKLL